MKILIGRIFLRISKRWLVMIRWIVEQQGKSYRWDEPARIAVQIADKLVTVAEWGMEVRKHTYPCACGCGASIITRVSNIAVNPEPTTAVYRPHCFGPGHYGWAWFINVEHAQKERQ